MSKHVTQFVEWIQSFDENLLQNEDDVETKFVLPLFQYLGYPEKCRRGKFPLKIYNPGKGGRKPEADQVFFSEEKPEKQNADSALVVVEAKEPEKIDLSEDISQAKFYGYHLNPIFLVITNGSKLIALKRHRFREEEVLFNDNIEKLRDRIQASQIYDHLNFEIVKRIKAQEANVITHQKYVKLDRALQQYPDLREILAKGV